MKDIPLGLTLTLHNNFKKSQKLIRETEGSFALVLNGLMFFSVKCGFLKNIE